MSTSASASTRDLGQILVRADAYVGVVLFEEANRNRVVLRIGSGITEWQPYATAGTFWDEAFLEAQLELVQHIYNHRGKEV